MEKKIVLRLITKNINEITDIEIKANRTKYKEKKM